MGIVEKRSRAAVAANAVRWGSQSDRSRIAGGVADGSHLHPQSQQDNKTVVARKRSTDALRWTGSEWEGVTPEDRRSWAAAHGVDVERELLKAGQWLAANPSRARKTLWRKFVVGWMSRASKTAKPRHDAGAQAERIECTPS